MATNLTPQMAKQARANALRPSLATFEPPVSEYQRRAIVKLGVSPELAFAAAIGLCWRGPGRPAVRWTAADPAGYGEAVFDELMGRSGVTYGEIVEVGARLYSQIHATVVTAAEVKEATGNSELEEAPSA